MVSEWTPQMMHVLGIDFGSLPIIWDADFLYGPRDASGRDTYLLCEINVSSVFPFPEEAPAEIARLATARLVSKNGARRSTIDGAANIVAQRWPSASRAAMFRTSAIIQDTCIEAKKCGRSGYVTSTADYSCIVSRRRGAGGAMSDLSPGCANSSYRIGSHLKPHRFDFLAFFFLAVFLAVFFFTADFDFLAAFVFGITFLATFLTSSRLSWLPLSWHGLRQPSSRSSVQALAFRYP